MTACGSNYVIHTQIAPHLWRDSLFNWRDLLAIGVILCSNWRYSCNRATNKGAYGGKSPRRVQAAINRLTEDLRKERPQRGPAQDLRQAIDIILTHLKCHGPYLSGQVINMPATKQGFRLVQRTNNLLEGEFHYVKHGERRRSGRKNLTQDFEVRPAPAFLADNLRHPDYVNLICGSLDHLAQAFAQLDAGDRSCSIASKALPNLPTAESASLSSADKQFIRQPLFQSWILAAAQV
jgi:hypothetical protein